MAVFEYPKDCSARVFSGEGANGEAAPEGEDVTSLHLRRGSCPGKTPDVRL